MENIREKRLKFSAELFEFFHKDPNTKNLSNEEIKEKVSNMLVEHFRDEKIINFFKDYQQNQVSHKSIILSKEEIAQTIKNVNGKIGYKESNSNLDYELWLQTQTPTYKKHIGEATPTVVYHGTKNNFSEFDDEIVKNQGRSDSLNNFGKGHYFTQNKEFASYYANGGEVKSVLINKNNFADISDTYISREQEEIKKDHSYLLLSSMVNQSINNPEKLKQFEVFARSLSFGDRAITDINHLQSLDKSVYQAVGFEGIKWEKMDGKDEIISFSARNIIHPLTNNQIEKIEKSLSINNPEQSKNIAMSSLFSEANKRAKEKISLEENISNKYSNSMKI
ncbi:hypothetical protein CBE90_04585 [Pasteurella multocida]|uniref:ADP-ribosyltransferase-containing protein n=1 Tax=Pasteurella multocida TaxID=747 RepID=UPI000CE8D32F|nr:hypothetical protein [Pasteurella multocida]PPE94919.1 hypothetical protein CBE90_04585 [Pasteurella multocida]PPE95039.1 hypothetical protein CBE91_10275 [Pasteurella multocida]HDR1236524.1 hypothetical protein [Pasteurella multocida]HDR1501680.1 hypothetical protein [Pasteurella multocida]